MRSWRADLLVALPAWAVARVVVAVGFVAAHAIGADDERGELTLDQGLLAWDGDWYHRLAERGYDGAPAEAIRYFPAYPLLGRWSGWVLAGRSDIGLVLVANGAALAATVVLVRLARRELGAEAAGRTAWWFSLFPASFVLVWAYSEAVFVLATAAAMLAARQRHWAIASLAGAAAALTRPTGVLLAGFILLLGWSGRRRSDRVGWITAILAPIAGLAVYLLWAEGTTGSWRAPLDAQRDIRGDFHEPLSRVIRSIGRGVSGDATELLHAGAAVVFIGVVVVVFRDRLPYLVYGLGGVLVGLAASTINSFERYGLGLVPVVLALGAFPAAEHTHRWALAGSATAMAGLTLAALTGQYVP